MKRNRDQKPSFRRRLNVEGLERRELFAGIVTATLSNGALVVTGDPANNRVIIWQNDATGEFSVTGQALNGATRINNLANNNTVTFTAPVTSIRVDMKGGDDRVTIARGAAFADAEALAATATVPLSVAVNGGAGTDRISISVHGGDVGPVNLPTASIVIDGGLEANNIAAQNDTILVQDTVASALAINTWGGNDRITVTQSIALALAINSGNIGSNADADVVNINTTAALSAVVSLGPSGNTAATDNELNVAAALLGTLVVTGGDGRDQITMTGVGTLNTSINTFGELDTILLTNVQAGLSNADFVDLANQLPPLPFGLNDLIASIPGIPGSLTVSSGEGNDNVRLTNVASIGSLFVLLAGGNDQLRTTNVTAATYLADGGLGTDRRSAAGSPLNTRLSFEGPNNL